jgi:hypothetical protein
MQERHGWVRLGAFNLLAQAQNLRVLIGQVRNRMNGGRLRPFSVHLIRSAVQPALPASFCRVGVNIGSSARSFFFQISRSDMNEVG